MTTTEQSSLTPPARIAEKAEAIYEKKFKQEMEDAHTGKFVAIDVLSEQCHRGDTAEEALQTARADSPNGVFHLIRVGALGAFSSSNGWSAGSWSP